MGQACGLLEHIREGFVLKMRAVDKSEVALGFDSISDLLFDVDAVWSTALKDIISMFDWDTCQTLHGLRIPTYGIGLYHQG